MDDTSKEFAEWWDGRQGVCEMNHSGSSLAMERAGALEIWTRSEDAPHLRFMEVISDGDRLEGDHRSKPYGKGVTITKYECGGHVQKRMGTRLRAVKRVIAKDKKAAMTSSRN